MIVVALVARGLFAGIGVVLTVLGILAAIVSFGSENDLESFGNMLGAVSLMGAACVSLMTAFLADLVVQARSR